MKTNNVAALLDAWASTNGVAALLRSAEFGLNRTTGLYQKVV